MYVACRSSCRGPGRTGSWYADPRERRLLHVAQRHPGIQRGGDEGVPERAQGLTALADPGAWPRDLADDPPGATPVEPTAVAGDEDRPVAAFADGQVDRPRGGAGRAGSGRPCRPCG